LVQIGVRAISAGIAALGFGVAIEAAGTYLAGDAGQRAVPAHISASEATPPNSFDRRASPVQVASVGTGFGFASVVEETNRASARAGASFEERFPVDQNLASFNERFGGTDDAPRYTLASAGEAEVPTSSVLSNALLPSPSPGTRAIARPAVGRAAPKLASLLSPTVDSGAKKRLASLEVPNDSSLSSEADSHTAIYDITAHTVYLPNGRRLEAHSGLGGHMDDPRYVNVRSRGATPPNVYQLKLREEMFHGVRAIRLTPVGGSKMFGRDGILAHSYMLGPNGQSNGCVSFSDYPAFLNAFLKGEVTRLVVVEHLSNPPSTQVASGWFPKSLKDLFGGPERTAASRPEHATGYAADQ
jgi:Protein of unknown function (DUF2778)